MIVERIKDIAKQYNTNISSLERDAGFGNGTIARWDISCPSADKLHKIANMLNVSMEWLLTGENTNIEIEEPELPLGLTDELLEKFDQLDTRDKNDIIDIIEMKYERIKPKQKLSTSTDTEKQSKSANEIA